MFQISSKSISCQAEKSSREKSGQTKKNHRIFLNSIKSQHYVQAYYLTTGVIIRQRRNFYPRGLAYKIGYCG